MSDADSADQLVNFFIYSLFVYPVTNYIVSPQRNYPRWKAALYAVLFLAFVAAVHWIYENSEVGPNYYQILHVTRDSPLIQTKRAFRQLSLELHPDKNKAEDAIDQFRKIQQAFDVISDREKHREYKRLGDYGLKLLEQNVIDYKFIILQIIVHYVSTTVFIFLMTFSEATNDAFSFAFFGLLVMLLIEMLLVVQEVPLPIWFFPQCTPHDIVTTMHQLFPAYLNGCRCISGAFYVDRKKHRELLLETISLVGRDIVTKQHNLIRTYEDIIYRDRALDNPATEGQDDEEDEQEEEEGDNVEDGGEEANAIENEGAHKESDGEAPATTAIVSSTGTIEGDTTRTVALAKKGKRKSKNCNHKEKTDDSFETGKSFQGMMTMPEMVAQARIRYQYSQEYRSKSIVKKMEEVEKNIADPRILAKRVLLPKQEEGEISDWVLFRDFLVYWLARWIFVKTRSV